MLGFALTLAASLISTLVLREKFYRVEVQVLGLCYRSLIVGLAAPPDLLFRLWPDWRWG